MKTSVVLTGVALAMCLTAVAACPRHQYVYNVVDLQEPMMRALGDYIAKILKTPRDERRETCYDHNSVYLDSFKTSTEKFDSVKMAGIFMHLYVHQPADVFQGIGATVEMLRQNCLFNLLITYNMKIRRFLVQNGTDGDIFATFQTEEELFSKMSHDKAWAEISVLHCQHYLHHLSTSCAKNVITVSLIDEDESEEQMQFTHLNAIGGFTKKTCNSGGYSTKTK